MTTTYSSAHTATRPVSLSREANTIRLAFSYNKELIERAQKLGFAEFDSVTSTWTAALCTQSVDQLRGWYNDGLTDVSIDSLIAPGDHIETIRPATLRPGSLRRPYQVSIALRDDNLYARLRAIAGASWSKTTRSISYPPSAAAALTELVERGVIDDPNKLLTPADLTVVFDTRDGTFRVNGDPRAKEAFDRAFPTRDIVTHWKNKGFDVAFSDAFSEEVYRGELARSGPGLQPQGLRATLWPYQAQSVAVATTRTGFGVFHEMGLGKALHHDTPVLTPSGFVAIKSLLPGHQVIGSSGRAVTVTGVFDQGTRQLYRVSFSDGASTLADANHLWALYNGQSAEYETLSTQQVIDRLSESTTELYVPLVAPVVLEAHPQPRARLDQLASLTRVCSSHVYVSESHTVEFADLVGSLGGVAHRVSCTASPTSTECFDVALPSDLIEEICTDPNSNLKAGVTLPTSRRLVAVTPASLSPAVCIKVDAEDELFVIEHYLLTHNTVIAIATGHELMFNQHEIKRTLVVVPGAVRTQWAEEIERFSTGEVVVIDGDLKHRKALYEDASSADWLIVSYDIATRDAELIEPLVTDSLLVLDESHRVKNPQSKRTKVMRKFALRASRRLALTGTAVSNEPGEWYSIISGVIAPGCFGSPQDFLGRYCYPSRFGGYEGARNLPELRQRSATYYARSIKSEVATHLPPLRVVHRPLDIDPTYRAILARLHRDAREEIKQEALRRATKRGRVAPVLDGTLTDEIETGAAMTAVAMLRMVCSSPRAVLNSQSPSAQALIEAGLIPDQDGPKIDELRTMVAELQEAGQRIVVFSFFEQIVKLIAERFDEDGIRYVTFTGSTSSKDRDAAKAAFTTAPTSDNPGPTVFLATDAGGEGLNLGAHCSLMVNIDIPWTPGVLAQRAARIHRIDGTADSYLVVNFTLKGTIEEGILRMVERKTDLQDAIFGEEGGRARTTGRTFGRRPSYDEIFAEVIEAFEIDEAELLASPEYVEVLGTEQSPTGDLDVSLEPPTTDPTTPADKTATDSTSVAAVEPNNTPSLFESIGDNQ